ncbi:putative oxidoreductase [Amycolatopsis arida]|uniref:Putative oxidoreductase n=1 Tax=Amycolatopsis arida TaxID=587909 RepID=A0A1I5R4U2_9PSEU|nr:DoxX family protein [Amycolatopsis arida]TDX99080.1 putative oxidoreductase [Amycolatopsis arida]SFP53529.1 putative oxidoreductase [Amycolatopsis arida]
MTAITTTPTATDRPETVRTRNREELARAATLGAVRIVVAFLFVCHGLQGLGLFGGIDGAGGAAPFGSWPGWWATILEVVAGGLVLLGLATRPAAILCSGAMAYAYFVVHQPMGLLPLQNLGEQAALFSWIFLLIGVFGPGAFAVDNLLRRRRVR